MRRLWASGVDGATFLARSPDVCLAPNGGARADIPGPPLGAKKGQANRADTLSDPSLARRHAVPDVAMQAPLAVATSDPNKKVLYLCLTGAEFQVGFASFIGSFAGNLKVDRLHSGVG